MYEFGSEFSGQYGDDGDSDYGDAGYPGLVSMPVPMDGVVNDVMGRNPALFGEIDETVDWIEEDPSRGWVGDAPWTDPVDGALGPVLGDTGDLGQIISGVLDDPDAPLSEDETAWVERETRINGHWNGYLDGIVAGRDVQDSAIDDLRRYNEQDALHNRIAEINDTLNDNANEINSWWSAEGGYGPTYGPSPWPSY